jgi:hypothetical protein
MAQLACAVMLIGCGGGAATTPDARAAVVDAAGLATTCTGACRTTALTAALAMTRTLDHAFYGVTASATGATLHVEAYLGGDPGCPTATSATTTYTLILGAVPIPTSTTPASSPGNVLDYQGDLLGGPLGAKATAVVVTPVAAAVCATCVGKPAPSDPGGFIALDLAMTFAAGTITGHVYATHCDSLDTGP